MTTKFLCVADVHIGRSSSGFEKGLDNEDQIDASALAAWERIVDLACEQKVAAILLAGDLFDDLNAQYRLRSKVIEYSNKLKQFNIRILAVAGNHDYEALPTLKQLKPELLTLFSSTMWECHEVQGVQIVGRSFTSERESNSLVESLNLMLDPGKTTIGLMHADIDSSNRHYNPVPLSSLKDKGVDVWILGHVHATKQWSNPLALYPGSPQALDAGETGIHGCYILKVDGRKCEFEKIQISTVRYETAHIDYRENDNLDELILNWISINRQNNEFFSLRIVLNAFSQASKIEKDLKDSIVKVDGHLYRIDLVIPRIEINLAQEAQQTSAGGQAARLLLGFKQQEELDTMVKNEELTLENRENWQKEAENLLNQVLSTTKSKLGQFTRSSDEYVARFAEPNVDEIKDYISESLWQIVLEAQGEKLGGVA
jgi:DNA repair exonuclease SbcCD nuclease subunit